MSPLAADADLSTTAYFSIYARVEPGVMPRVLELFAKRGLVPTSWHSAITGTALEIDIAVTGLDAQAGRHITVCLQQIADIEAVLTVASPCGIFACRSS